MVVVSVSAGIRLDREVKRRTHSHLRFDPDAATVAVSTIFRQIARPMPVPRVLSPGMQPLEDLEDALGVRPVDADAIVADRKAPRIPVADGQTCTRGGSPLRYLMALPIQVLQQLSQLAGVSP